jgi:hypothetical protein
MKLLIMFFVVNNVINNEKIIVHTILLVIKTITRKVSSWVFIFHLIKLTLRSEEQESEIRPGLNVKPQLGFVSQLNRELYLLEPPHGGNGMKVLLIDGS